MQPMRYVGLYYLIAVVYALCCWCPIASAGELTMVADRAGNIVVVAANDESDRPILVWGDVSETPMEAAYTWEGILGNSISHLFNAIADNSGMVSVNQSSGNLVHQSNIRLFSLSAHSDTLFTLDAGATSILESVIFISSGVSEKSNLLDGSFQGNTVLAGVNQSAGSLNQQSNRALMVIGGLATLSDAELGRTRATNISIDENGVERCEDAIVNSFTSSRGIFQVSQAAGNLNIQENNIAVSFRQIQFE